MVYNNYRKKEGQKGLKKEAWCALTYKEERKLENI